MSTFDPETGVRSRAEAPDRPAVSRPKRNPYSTALAAVWMTAAALAVVLVLVAAGQRATAGPSGAGTMAGAGVLAAFAGVAGLVHLAVLAIAWRPPQG